MERNECTQEDLSVLPREELRRMLTEELQKDLRHIDDTFVRLLLTELRTRGCDPAFTDDESVSAACTKFQLDSAHILKPGKPWYQHWMIKVASVILVLGILFFSLPAAAEASNIREVFGWWSDSVFQLFNPGKMPLTQEYTYETDHPGLQEIYDTVTELGITEQIVPRKLSNEFELTELKVIQFLEDKSINAHLTSKEHRIIFTVVPHSEQTMLQHEKTDSNASVWELAGIDHYLISNTTENTVSWVIGHIECSVITDCPEEDVYNLIKSIYTSEG